MKRNIQNFRKLLVASGAMFLLSGLVVSAPAGEEFRTNRGKVYHDCNVISHDDYGIMIRHRGGAARIGYSDLSRSVQERYGYDRGAADKYVKRHAPERPQQLPQKRPVAKHFNGFSPKLAATRAHLAFAGGLLAAPFAGSLGVPGVKSFDAWQTYTDYSRQNPYHSSHTYKIRDGYVQLNNRRRRDCYNGGHHYQYAYRRHQIYNPYSYLRNGVRYGNPIAPGMGIAHTRATNSGNPIAPAMMSWGMYQDARARAWPSSASVRNSVRRPVHLPARAGGGRGGK